MKRFVCLVLALALLCAVQPALAKTQVLTLDLVARVLDDCGVRYVTGEKSADYLALPINGVTSDIILVLSVDGEDADCLLAVLLMTADLCVQEDGLTDAYNICNLWNTNDCFPTAVIDLSDFTFGGVSMLFCTSDVTDNMIYEFVRRSISGSKDYVQFLLDSGYEQFASCVE